MAFTEARKIPPVKLENLQNQVEDILSGFGRRLQLMEERVSTLGNHTTLLERDLVDKHKETIKNIRSLESDIREMRSDMDNVNSTSERLIKRLDAFASKENVKVLQRYIEMWQPLQFVTRNDLNNAVERQIKQRGNL